ncbi:MAG: kynureninase [Bacteroidales bacterium]
MNAFTEKYAQDLDRNDPIRGFRNKFRIVDDNLIYLDGNSLGRPVKDSLVDLVKGGEYAWAGRLIRSWNEDWYTKSLQLGDKIAMISGASPGEMIVTDSTSVNLYKLVYSALKKQEGRTKIITDDLNFPSDLYILQGVAEEFGAAYEVVILESEDGITISREQLARAIDEKTALVTLSHVVFKSAFMYSMEEITDLAHRKGAMVLWDLSHSIGSVPVELNRSGVDMAVGCTYKYLNGGPGSPAFLYVTKELQEQLHSPISGWFGTNKPFSFDLKYTPAPGIRKFMAGTPPILSMIPLERSLEVLIEAGMNNIRKKSMSQSAYFVFLTERFLFHRGFSLGSPVEAELRGSHITLKHPEAHRICSSLADPDTGRFEVIPDFREPDNIRIGISPLYTRYIDLYRTVKEMELILEEGLFKKFPDTRKEVT